MTDAERAALEKRYRGKRSKDSGEYLEGLIDSACDFYRNQGFADIEKTPEPMRPIRSLGNGKYIAVYTKAAQTDYKGMLAGGMTVYFEAKHTDSGRLTQDRVTPNQTERLERAYRMGALVFVVCGFGMAAFYRIPWSCWRDMKSRFGHKYITPAEAAPYEVHYTAPGVLMFLEGIHLPDI